MVASVIALMLMQRYNKGISGDTRKSKRSNMKSVKSFPLLAMGVLAFGLVGVTALAPVANANQLLSGSHTSQPQQNKSGQQTVQAVVPMNLGINLSAGSELIQGKPGEISKFAEGNVTSNSLHGYTVTLKDADEFNGMRLNGTDAQYEIPAVNDVTAAGVTKGWNILLGDQPRKVPTSKETPLTVDSTNKPGDGKFYIRYNFKVDNSVPQGVYSDTVTFTVTPNTL